MEPLLRANTKLPFRRVFFFFFFFFTNNIEGKITECWLVNEESIFFLNFALWRGQNYWLTIGPQLTWQQLIQSRNCFSVTMASRFEIYSWRGIYRRIKGHERKWKQEEKHGVVKERFNKKWPNERNRRVRERCPRPTIVAVLSIKKFSNFALYVINK